MTVPLWRLVPSNAPQLRPTLRPILSRLPASSVDFACADSEVPHPSPSVRNITALVPSDEAPFAVLRPLPLSLVAPCAHPSVCPPPNLLLRVKGRPLVRRWRPSSGRTPNAFACVLLVPGWPHRVCSLGLASHRTCHPVRSARLSCPLPALPPSSSPLIRRRSHSCVFDVDHSSEFGAQRQGGIAKSPGYPQEFGEIHRRAELSTGSYTARDRRTRGSSRFCTRRSS